MTKDESYLLKLHQMAQAKGGPEEEVDRYKVGRAIGLNDRGIDTIVRTLCQTNFVKKGEDTAIYLTQNGLVLVHQLLGK